MRTLHIAPNIESLRDMSIWVKSTCRELGCSDQVSFCFELAANEAVTNIISYAGPDVARSDIALRMWVSADEALLEVEDAGVAFNPLLQTEPTRTPSLADAVIGGWGIPIIRGCVAHCAYRREAGRNVLTLKSPFAPHAIAANP